MAHPTWPLRRDERANLAVWIVGLLRLMLRLPPHHIPRPRITDRCNGYQVIVVEAAAGYGKSVLAAELVDVWRSIAIGVQLEHGGVDASLLAARLHEAARRSGFTDAGVASATSQGPVGALDAMIAALAGECCTFVIDDAHNAREDAANLIEHLATQLEGAQRLVVLGRQLPKGSSRLRRAEFLQLTAADLALIPAETLVLCRSGFGLEASPEAAEVLDRATQGWTAATVLAAARAVRTGQSVAAVAEAATGPGHPGGAVAAILEEALLALGPSGRPLLAQIARLPLLDADLVAVVARDEEFFDRARQVGLPFAPARGQWWDLPGPVRDYLAGLAPRDADTMLAAAEEYRRRGELWSALELLLASGEAKEAASVMATIPPAVEETLDTMELRARFEQFPDPAVDDHPEILVLLARRLGHAGLYSLCCELLGRARDIARARGDEVLDRAARAEMVKVRFLAEMKYARAEEEAREVLARSSPEERLTRARANEFLGFALCRRVDSAGRLDEAALDEADDCLARASAIYRDLGMRSAASFVAVDRAVHIDFPRGRVAGAKEGIEQALVMVADRPRARGFVMVWRELFAAELGDDELCRSSAAEVFQVAEQIKSPFLAAQGHWKLAVLASYREDGESALHHLRETELLRGAWWGLLSGEFLAEAADLLDRVGYEALALEYLARARDEPGDAGHLVALAEAAIEARHGDPVLAERRLVALAQQRLDAREQWRVTLLRGFAAYRRGGHDQAGALAARACEQAAQLGLWQAPLLRERVVTEQLLGLATATGQPAVLALKATALPMFVAVLGRFELTVAGRSVSLVPGQEARLLKFVAASGGQVHSEQAIEALWPEAGRAEGRNRLRTVLHRLRLGAGEVLARSGETLVLGTGLRVDLAEFLAEAERAQALAATDPALGAAVANGAIARYRGDVLPEERYEDWAEKPRRSARSVMLGLLDLCAKSGGRPRRPRRLAPRRGEVDRARPLRRQALPPGRFGSRGRGAPLGSIIGRRAGQIGPRRTRIVPT